MIYQAFNDFDTNCQGAVVEEEIPVYDAEIALTTYGLFGLGRNTPKCEKKSTQACLLPEEPQRAGIRPHGTDIEQHAFDK
jgi:hypothetical protein